MTKGRPAQDPVVKNVEEIARLEGREFAGVSTPERLSMAVTGAMGTPASAGLHLLALLLWTGWNVVAPANLRWDPYPFPLLTMIVSMEGLIVALFVLITQNRMSAQSDTRDHLHLQVNLLAEQEMTMVLRMLARIADRLGVPADDREQEEAQRLMERTNLYELLQELRRTFR